MRHLSTLILTGTLAAAACGPSYSADRDSSIPVPAGATYALIGGANVGEERDPNLQSGIVHQRIQNAIKSEMAAKGFKEAPEATADFHVRYFIGIKTSTVYNTTTTGVGYRGPYGYGWGWGGGMTTTYPTEVSEGGGVIDLVQRTTGKTAYRATYKGDTPNSPPNQEKVDNTVRTMLKDLKPGA
ncbi:MAG: DUF4136 domain-containing protein [Gemmatimonadota bacterium]|jgi:hypothetical protein|nr:DUF4136 domain-containing protein [Gemmatimonadota bacterium]